VNDVKRIFKMWDIISDIISWRKNNKNLLFSQSRKKKIENFSYITVYCKC